MPAPFAALDARVNRAVASRLANKEALFTLSGGGDDVSVMVDFGRDEQDMPPSMGGPRRLGEWLAGAPAEDFAGSGVDEGVDLRIDGVVYRITDISTDETGWMTLNLRRAG